MYLFETRILNVVRKITSHHGIRVRKRSVTYLNTFQVFSQLFYLSFEFMNIKWKMKSEGQKDSSCHVIQFLKATLGHTGKKSFSLLNTCIWSVWKIAEAF